VQLQGYNALKASFSSTIQARQFGHALLAVTPPGANKENPAEKETFLITLPSLHIESLIYGTPFVELEKSTRIASSTGYIAKIDYSGRGWVSGKKNTFSAILYKESDGEKNPLYTIDGQWSDTFVIKDARTKKDVDTYIVGNMKTTPLEVAVIEEQDAYESRRAWHDVARAIERGDMEATSVAKSRIENAQRELRKREREEGREWERRFFTRVDERDDAVFLRLARMLDPTSGNSLGTENDKTGGVWRFDKERAKDAVPPYHQVGSQGLGLSE
jgi:oxysterol-binding protein-related protein 9/10/11